MMIDDVLVIAMD